MKTFFGILVTTLLIFSQSTWGLNNADRQDMYFKNILAPWNSGFENGKSVWTISGGDTLTAVASGSNLMVGSGSITWNSAGASRILASKAVTIPNGFYGGNGYAQCKIQVPSGAATHTISVYDGTNTLVSSTVLSSTLPTFSGVNFIFPSTGTIQIRITSVAADEPLIAIDDCYIGGAYNLSAISQAQFIGSAYFATTASCTFTVTSTTLAAMSDADCPGPTVELNPGPGVIQTTDADAPNVTVNNLPAGTYRVTFAGESSMSTSSSGNSWAINDGTTTAGQTGGGMASATDSQSSVEAFFTYTTGGNRTFKLYAASASNAMRIENSAGTSRLFFTIQRFPLVSEMGFRPDAGPASWSGYHVAASCGAWARTNTAYGDVAVDADCNLTERLNRNFGTVTSHNTAGDELPGIVFTPPRVGFYYVCASASIKGATAGADLAVKLYDGTTTIAERDWDAPVNDYVQNILLCGIYSATSVAAKTLELEVKASTGAITITALTAISTIEWSIVGLDFSLNAPILVGSVTNAGTGASRIEAANINCDAGSATTSEFNGSDVVSGAPGNISAGACAVTLVTGLFSGTPYCWAEVTGAISTGLELSVTATSATAVSVDCETDASAECSAFDANLFCLGAR